MKFKAGTKRANLQHKELGKRLYLGQSMEKERD